MSEEEQQQKPVSLVSSHQHILKRLSSKASSSSSGSGSNRRDSSQSCLSDSSVSVQGPNSPINEQSNDGISQFQQHQRSSNQQTRSGSGSSLLKKCDSHK